MKRGKKKNTLWKRWSTNMPKFFKRLSYSAATIAAGILAFHTSMQETGGVEPEWFTNYYSTVLGICGGIVATSKFTRTYNENDESRIND